MWVIPIYQRMGMRENDWNALQFLIKYKVLKMQFCGDAILSLLIFKNSATN